VPFTRTSPDIMFSATPTPHWPWITTVAAGTPSTFTDAVAFLLFDCAVMIASPFATPVTRPASETVAIDGFEDDHFGTTPLTMRPLSSSAEAVSCRLSPGRIEAFSGATVRDDVGPRRTSTEADAVTPLSCALIVTDPSSRPVITPSALMVATVLIAAIGAEVNLRTLFSYFGNFVSYFDRILTLGLRWVPERTG